MNAAEAIVQIIKFVVIFACVAEATTTLTKLFNRRLPLFQIIQRQENSFVNNCNSHITHKFTTTHQEREKRNRSYSF